jgi:hypothetical protein
MQEYLATFPETSFHRSFVIWHGVFSSCHAMGRGDANLFPKGAIVRVTGGYALADVAPAD